MPTEAPGHQVAGSPTAAQSPRTGSAGKRPLRLLRSDRLRKRFEFRRARDEGRRVHTASFVFQVARSEGPGCRLGLTVSRKVGSAVRRNRIKRLLRETFRLERELFPERADVVVIAKDTCQVRSLADVQAELTGARVALAKAAQKAAAFAGSRPAASSGRRPLPRASSEGLKPRASSEGSKPWGGAR